ncbi:MAG: hypothetical protein ACI8WB_005677 [Phenylobacterium sp.]|jgi:hypothetical protein
MTIKVNKVEAQRGVYWITKGWGLFKQQSGLWMQTMVFIVGLGIGAQLLGQASVVTIILYAFAHPFLMAGYYHMAFQAKNGVDSKFTDVFIAFKDLRIRRVMFQLASISLLVTLTVSALGADNVEALKEGQALDAGPAFLYAIISLIYLMFFFFTVPIVYFFHEQNLLRILKLSFTACWRNIAPLAVFALMALGLCLMTMPTLLLGLFIVLPWLSIAFYLSFDDVFGDDLPADFEQVDGQDNRKDDVTFIV